MAADDLSKHVQRDAERSYCFGFQMQTTVKGTTDECITRITKKYCDQLNVSKNIQNLSRYFNTAYIDIIFLFLFGV